MARSIIILTLMIAITAAMFAITRKSTVAPGEAANGPTATVKLTDLPRVETTAAAVGETAPAKVHDEEAEGSPTSADPRPVTNALNPQDVPATQTTQDVAMGPRVGAAPSVGTAGIDHRGKASFTGTATPGDTVTLFWDGKAIRSAKADPAGNWAIEFKAPIAKDKHDLYVSAKAKDRDLLMGPQRVTVRPAAADGGLPRITLTAADHPETALGEHRMAANEPETGIVVEKITLSQEGVVVTGRADPAATVRAEINGRQSGETRVAANGAWTLVAPNRSGKAADRLRLELLSAKGTKLDAAELPVEVPVPDATKTTVAETAAKQDVSPAASPATSAPIAQLIAKTAPAAENLSTALKRDDVAKSERPKRRIVRVRRGDSLWRIAKRHLGKGRKWAAFYKANKAKIDNPDMIYPGQTLIIPG